jgi:hypothetical protein
VSQAVTSSSSMSPDAAVEGADEFVDGGHGALLLVVD